MAIVSEMITRFSFQGSTQPLANYNQALNRGIGLLAGMAAAVGTASAAMARWTSRTLSAIAPLEHMSRVTGESVRFIQEMGFVAEQTGSSTQAMRGTVDALSQAIGDAAQHGSEEFSRLGISVRNANGEVKSAEQVLFEVQDRFQQLNLSMAEQRTFAESLGIDSSLLQLLNRSRGEIEGLREEAREWGILTSEQTDQAAEYDASIRSLNFGLDSLKNLIAVGLAPEMQQLVGWFKEVLRENKDWVIEGVQTAAEGIGVLIDSLKRLAPFIGAAAVAFAGLKVATLGFTGALAALFSPAVLIAGAIAGVLLVLDDLIVAFRGGDSVIRDFFLEFFGWDIQPVLQGIVDGYQWMIGKIREVITSLLEFNREMGEAIYNVLTGNFSDAWDNIKNATDALVRALRAPFTEFFDWIERKFAWLINSVSGLGEFLGFGETGDESTAAQNTGTTGLGPGPGSGHMDNRRVEINQTNSFDIRTDRPETAAGIMERTLQRQLEDTQTQVDRGGM